MTTDVVELRALREFSLAGDPRAFAPGDVVPTDARTAVVLVRSGLAEMIPPAPTPEPSPIIIPAGARTAASVR
jgi:hypothetical protein